MCVSIGHDLEVSEPCSLKVIFEKKITEIIVNIAVLYSTKEQFTSHVLYSNQKK